MERETKYFKRESSHLIRFTTDPMADRQVFRRESFIMPSGRQNEARAIDKFRSPAKIIAERGGGRKSWLKMQVIGNDGPGAGRPVNSIRRRSHRVEAPPLRKKKSIT